MLSRPTLSNFVGRNPLFWVDDSLDKQIPTFKNRLAELPALPAPIKNLRLHIEILVKELAKEIVISQWQWTKKYRGIKMAKLVTANQNITWGCKKVVGG